MKEVDRAVNRKNVSLTLRVVLLVLSLSVISSMGIAGENPTENTSAITDGARVKVRYTLTVDGKVIDSSTEREPFRFQLGSRQVIPGFEAAIKGMKTGEKKTFSVAPEEGYGPEDPKAIQEVPRDKLSADIKPEPGMTIYAKGTDGRSIPVRIIEVKENTVLMDFNHPLAGKTLQFEVEVLEIY